MANTYFQFKEFKIEQKSCANKVSSDACVFGALLAKHLPRGKVLDVGVGSGLLSLMLAQTNKHRVTGVEIDSSCLNQAKENVEESEFKENITLVNYDIRVYQHNSKLDFIISNPPFFNNTSKSEDAAKNRARQTESLGPEDWETILEKNATSSTLITLLLSNNDVLKAYERQLQKSGFIFQNKTLLLDKADVDCKRVILWASKKELIEVYPLKFIYKEQDGNYTKAFVALLKDYYLYL